MRALHVQDERRRMPCAGVRQRLRRRLAELAKVTDKIVLESREPIELFFFRGGEMSTLEGY